MSDLVDQYGRRLALAAGPGSLYKTPSKMGGDFRAWPQPRAKTYEAVTSWQRREMVDISRVLAAGVPLIDSALKQAGEFAIGDSWHIKSRSSNRSWGKKRDEWFNEVYARDCNSRGPQYDWLSSLRVLNWSRKVEGDYGIIFDGKPRKDSSGKEYAPTGKFSIIKYDRISTGVIGGWQGVAIVGVGNGLDECKELPKTWNYYSGASGWSSWPGIYIINDKTSIFDGERIIDGVIIDANMKVLGYRLVGFSPGGLPVYCDIAKEQMHFNFSARQTSDYIRGIPELASKIIPLMHLDDVQHLISMAMKLASVLAIARESVDGNAMRAGRVEFEDREPMFDSSGNPVLDTAGNQMQKETKRAVSEFFPGLWELNVSNKEKLGVLEFNRPTMNEEAFIRRVEKAVLHDLWPRDLIYAEDSGRAGTRAIAVQANTISNWDQKCVERDARFIADRATEFAMRTGLIPMNDNLDDPYQHVFTIPAKFSVDEGNDLKGYLLSLSRCCISRGIICEMGGYLAEEIEEAREDEIDRILSAAERLAKKHDDFSVKELALMLDSGGQNISFADNAQSDEPEEETAAAGNKPPRPDEDGTPPTVVPIKHKAKQ